MGKDKSSKGTFGQTGLPLSKAYLIPVSRRRMLLIGAGIAGLLLLFAVFDLLRERTSFISNGPLSSNHANLESDCAACHDRFDSVTSENCSVCHEKFGDQFGVYTFRSHYVYRSGDFARVSARDGEFPCFACHVEHVGRQTEITEVLDSRCLGCHAFGSFNQDHPPFLQATRHEDSGIKFPHIRHVREVMQREDLADVERACLYCHRADPEGESFQPIDFVQHCDACHLDNSTATPRLPVRQGDSAGVETLEAMQKRHAPGSSWTFYANPNEFTVRGSFVRKRPVHHADPWILDNLRTLRRRLFPDAGLADLLRTSPENVESHELGSLYEEVIARLRDQAVQLRSRPEREVQDELSRIQTLLVRVERDLRDPYTPLDETEFLLALSRSDASPSGAELEQIEELVQDLTEPCRRCHLVEDATIARVHRDQRTMHRAEFNHRAHILQRRCLDCHSGIPFEELLGSTEPIDATRDNADILNLPSIETCQACHTAKLASNRCVTCHDFHPDKSRRSELLLYVDEAS